MDFYYQFQNQFWNSKGNVMRWHAPIVCCQEISDIKNYVTFEPIHGFQKCLVLTYLESNFK